MLMPNSPRPSRRSKRRKQKSKKMSCTRQANIDSKINSTHANELREIYRSLLELEEMNLEHCQSSQAYETEVVASFPGYAAKESQLAAYHAALSRKYHCEASRPWFGVDADPPTPKSSD